MSQTANEVDASSAEAEAATDEQATDEQTPSVIELLVQLGRDVSVLVFLESQLAASRNLPEVRRAVRDISGAVIAALAFLTAFAFVNVAAVSALGSVVSTAVAALALCAAWLALGAALTLALMVRAGRVSGWRWWRVFRAGPEESLEDLERARGDAEETVRGTLGRLAPAMTVEIASASVSVAGELAGDMAGDLVDAGADVLETSDQVVEAIAEQLPGGGVVNQVWDVVLAPGRFGVKAATTVFRRTDASPTDRETGDRRAGPS